MSDIRFDVRIEGLNELLRSIDAQAVANDIDNITESYTRKMANETAEKAPRKTGKLANSFPPSVKKEAHGHWSYGSDVPYATRQEYEHKTKKGFVRNTVSANKIPYKDKLVGRLNELGRR